MTSKPRSPKTTSDNERTSVNSLPGGEAVRGDQLATGLTREESSGSSLGLSHPALTPMPAALRRDARNPLGLSHPAITPMPLALRSRVPAPTMGSRRVAVAMSPYAVHSEGRGQLVELVAFLQQVRIDVLEGSSITRAVSDGTLWGWRARLALSDCAGQPVAVWDEQPGRTQGERLALVDRSLAECGVERHRGGWSVSR